MTISTTGNQVTYTGDGASLAFAFPYPFITNADLKVYVNGVLQATGYSVAGVAPTGGSGTFQTGTVTFSVAPVALATILIYCDPDQLQSFSFPPNDPFPAKTIEKALDKLTLLIQRLMTKFGNAITYPAGDTANGVLPAASVRAGNLVSFDSLGNAQVVAPVAGTATALAIDLASTALSTKNSGQIGFAYGLGYAAGTIGRWLQDLALSGGSAFFGWIQSGTGAILRTVQAKLRDVKHVKDFGAVCDGVTNDIVAFQAAHDAIEAAGGGTLYVSRMKLNGPFIWNPNLVQIVGDGCTLDWSSLSGTLYAITLRQTSTDANNRGALCRAHPWTGCQFYGTGSATGTITFIKVADNNPIGGTNYIADGVTFDKCSCTNWYRDFEFGNGAFFFNFTNGHCNITGGSGYDTSLLMTSATNGGENLNFSGSYISKVTGSIIRNVNPNSAVILNGCSLDYTANIADCQAGGTTSLTNCYIENNTDSDYWFKVTGTNTLLHVDGEVVSTGNKSAKEIFSSDATCTNGGLDLDIVMQYGVTTYPLKLIAGTGRARYRQRASANAGVHPAIGAGTNQIANGQMLTAVLTDWTLTGTAPTASAVHTRPGAAFSLRVVNTGSAVRTLPCKPGEYLTGELYYWLDGVGASGGTFLVQVDYRDAGGTSLAGNAVVNLSTNASVAVFTRAVLSMLSSAPAGTASATLQITMFGVGAGTPAGFAGDIQFAVV